MHPSRMLGRALGFAPLVQHVPLHFVQGFVHLGGAGVGGQLQAVTIGVKEVNAFENGVVGRAQYINTIGL